MLCRFCHKSKSKAEWNRMKRCCRSCLKKRTRKQYNLKNKVKIKEYFKKWYQVKGKQRRREKNYPRRNSRIYELFMNPNKRLAIQSLANIFQISRSRVAQIIKDEEKKRRL